MKRKTEVVPFTPVEFYQELQTAIEQLGQLASRLSVPVPKDKENLERLTKAEFKDLWLAAGRNSRRIDSAWHSEAARIINQALAADITLPDSSEPKE